MENSNYGQTSSCGRLADTDLSNDFISVQLIDVCIQDIKPDGVHIKSEKPLELGGSLLLQLSFPEVMRAAYLVRIDKLVKDDMEQDDYVCRFVNSIYKQELQLCHFMHFYEKRRGRKPIQDNLIYL